jgi:hypothetical protein
LEKIRKAGKPASEVKLAALHAQAPTHFFKGLGRPLDHLAALYAAPESESETESEQSSSDESSFSSGFELGNLDSLDEEQSEEEKSEDDSQ